MTRHPREPPREPGVDTRDDAALLAAHVVGDTEAFGVLVARHRDRLWAVALRTAGNAEDAADGLQDGLVAAYRRAESFRGECAVTTWLHRVVVNACLDRLRAQRVRAAEPLTADLAGRGPGRQPPGLGGTPATDPLAAVELAERRDRVVGALAALPAEQRAALVLVDMEGWSVAEAAVALDCAPGTVKSRCSRGRHRLAVVLADLLPDHAAPAAAAGPRNPSPAGDVGSLDPPRGPPG